MPEVRNKSIEQAAAELEQTLRPETDWPEPTNVNDRFAAAEEEAITWLEQLEREGRASMTGF